MFFVVMGKLQRVDENGDELDMGERRERLASIIGETMRKCAGMVV